MKAVGRSVMADLRSYKVRDLEPDSRTVVERLLGRPLHENVWRQSSNVLLSKVEMSS